MHIYLYFDFGQGSNKLELTGSDIMMAMECLQKEHHGELSRESLLRLMDQYVDGCKGHASSVKGAA
jgi:hypothetical protein